MFTSSDWAAKGLAREASTYTQVSNCTRLGKAAGRLGSLIGLLCVRSQSVTVMRIRTRLGVSVCLSVCSLVAIALLLPSSVNVSARLQRIALGASSSVADHAGWWGWGGRAKEGAVSVRLVVFGDSWVDNTVVDGEDGKGTSWTEVLCDEVWITTSPLR